MPRISDGKLADMLALAGFKSVDDADLIFDLSDARRENADLRVQLDPMQQMAQEALRQRTKRQNKRLLGHLKRLKQRLAEARAQLAAANQKYALLEQSSGEYCEVCGWNGILGDQPCAICAVRSVEFQSRQEEIDKRYAEIDAERQRADQNAEQCDGLKAVIKALEDENNSLGERADTAEAELDRLKRWKAEMLIVESTWDEQAVGDELEIDLGTSIRPNILPKIKALKAALKVAEADNAALINSIKILLFRTRRIDYNEPHERTIPTLLTAGDIRDTRSLCEQDHPGSNILAELDRLKAALASKATPVTGGGAELTVEVEVEKDANDAQADLDRMSIQFDAAIKALAKEGRKRGQVEYERDFWKESRDTLAARVKVLEEALRFYSNLENWKGKEAHLVGYMSEILVDGGARAREALKVKP